MTVVTFVGKHPRCSHRPSTEQRYLTRALKRVDGKIAEFYLDRIDYLFTPQGKDICSPQNRMIIKRLG